MPENNNNTDECTDETTDECTDETTDECTDETTDECTDEGGEQSSDQCHYTNVEEEACYLAEEELDSIEPTGSDDPNDCIAQSCSQECTDEPEEEHTCSFESLRVRKKNTGHASYLMIYPDSAAGVYTYEMVGGNNKNISQIVMELKNLEDVCDEHKNKTLITPAGNAISWATYNHDMAYKYGLEQFFIFNNKPLEEQVYIRTCASDVKMVKLVSYPDLYFNLKASIGWGIQTKKTTEWIKGNRNTRTPANFKHGGSYVGAKIILEIKFDGTEGAGGQGILDFLTNNCETDSSTNADMSAAESANALPDGGYDKCLKIECELKRVTEGYWWWKTKKLEWEIKVEITKGDFTLGVERKSEADKAKELSSAKGSYSSVIQYGPVKIVNILKKIKWYLDLIKNLIAGFQAFKNCLDLFNSPSTSQAIKVGGTVSFWQQFSYEYASWFSEDSDTFLARKHHYHKLFGDIVGVHGEIDISGTLLSKIPWVGWFIAQLNEWGKSADLAGIYIKFGLGVIVNGNYTWNRSKLSNNNSFLEHNSGSLRGDIPLSITVGGFITFRQKTYVKYKPTTETETKYEAFGMLAGAEDAPDDFSKSERGAFVVELKNESGDRYIELTNNEVKLYFKVTETKGVVGKNKQSKTQMGKDIQEAIHKADLPASMKGKESYEAKKMVKDLPNVTTEGSTTTTEIAKGEFLLFAAESIMNKMPLKKNKELNVTELSYNEGSKSYRFNTPNGVKTLSEKEARGLEDSCPMPE